MQCISHFFMCPCTRTILIMHAIFSKKHAVVYLQISQYSKNNFRKLSAVTQRQRSSNIVHLTILTVLTILTTRSHKQFSMLRIKYNFINSFPTCLCGKLLYHRVSSLLSKENIKTLSSSVISKTLTSPKLIGT